jgi:hypothetical protein
MKQRRELGGYSFDLMRLQSEDDGIVGSGLGDAAHGRHLPHDLLFRAAFGSQLQAAALNGGEMGTTRDQGYFFTGEGELRPHQSTDGSGADNTDLHEPTILAVDRSVDRLIR